MEKIISNMTFVDRDSPTLSSHSQAYTDLRGVLCYRWLYLLFPLSSPKARPGERQLLDGELWPPSVMAFGEGQPRPDIVTNWVSGSYGAIPQN